MRPTFRSQQGFSLIELLMAAVIVSMLAAIAIPSLLGSKEAAESTAAMAALRAMHTNQIIHRTTQGRFARLSELNNFSGNIFGSVNGTTLSQKGWTYLMSPTPTNVSLRSQYQIFAYKIKQGRVVSAYSVAQDGTIISIVTTGTGPLPVPTPTVPGNPAP